MPVNALIAGEIVETLVNSVRPSVKDGVWSSRISGSVRTFVKGAGENLVHLGFQVVNFSDFMPPGPRPSFGFSPSTAELLWNGWRIHLSAVDQSEKIFKSLDETGGYAFTHMGRLDRVDGATFSADDGEGVLDATAFLVLRAALPRILQSAGASMPSVRRSGNGGALPSSIPGRDSTTGSTNTTAIFSPKSSRRSLRPMLTLNGGRH